VKRKAARSEGMAPYGRKRLAPYARKRVAPYPRKRLAPYADNDWTTIGRELTGNERRHCAGRCDRICTQRQVRTSDGHHVGGREVRFHAGGVPAWDDDVKRACQVEQPDRATPQFVTYVDPKDCTGTCRKDSRRNTPERCDLVTAQVWSLVPATYGEQPREQGIQSCQGRDRSELEPAKERPRRPRERRTQHNAAQAGRRLRSRHQGKWAGEGPAKEEVVVESLAGSEHERE
jgi:hypothetical protein